MLEQRPIVKRSLYGTGAFMFVFAAAMAGTAFMISGGIGSGEHGPADPPAYQIAANDAWQNQPAATAPAPEHATVTPASLQAPAPAAQPLAAPGDANVVVISTTPPPQAPGLEGADAAQPEPSITPVPDQPSTKPDGT